GAQRIGDLEIAAEEAPGLGPAPDRQEVEELDEEARPAAAPLADRVDQGTEPRDESVVADPEQGTARDVADAGRLDDQDAGLALGEPRVPLEDLRRHEAIGGGAPGHHRRDPGALGGGQRPSDPDRREPAGAGGVVAGGPARRRQRVTDAMLRVQFV